MPKPSKYIATKVLKPKNRPHRSNNVGADKLELGVDESRTVIVNVQGPSSAKSKAKGKQLVPQRGSHNAKPTLNRWLGIDATNPTRIVSDFDIIRAGAEGITKASIDELASHLGITRKSMAEDILDLSVKTLERKAPKQRLDKKASSHALEIARILQHAFEVFEDELKVKRWLNTANKALNGIPPLQLFDTLTGLNMVTDILTRIEEGVYS